MDGGAAFVLEPFTQDGTASVGEDPSWPTAVLTASGGFTVYGPEQDVALADGDLLLRLHQPALVAASQPDRRRWFRISKQDRVRRQKARPAIAGAARVT